MRTAVESIPKIADSEVTPPELYFRRRQFLRAGLIAGSALATASLYRRFNPVNVTETVERSLTALRPTTKSQEELIREGLSVSDEPTPAARIMNYNNFYEFTTSKTAVAAAAEISGRMAGRSRLAGW